MCQFPQFGILLYFISLLKKKMLLIPSMNAMNSPLVLLLSKVRIIYIQITCLWPLFFFPFLPCEYILTHWACVPSFNITCYISHILANKSLLLIMVFPNKGLFLFLNCHLAVASPLASNRFSTCGSLSSITWFFSYLFFFSPPLNSVVLLPENNHMVDAWSLYPAASGILNNIFPLACLNVMCDEWNLWQNLFWRCCLLFSPLPHSDSTFQIAQQPLPMNIWKAVDATSELMKMDTMEQHSRKA